MKINFTSTLVSYQRIKNFENYKTQLIKLKLLLLFLFFSTLMYSQNPSGISIIWNVSTGCQTYSEEIKDGRDPLFIENILEGECITVCENTQVTYTLIGSFATVPNTTWNVTGGVINNQTSSSCVITWGASGAGELTFSTMSISGLVNKTICFNKAIKPSVLFTIEPTPLGRPLVGCSNQTLYFNNLSTTNGGTGLDSYLWDFGDGTISTAFEPSHIYAQDGFYDITLTVTNSCGCSSKFVNRIKIGKIGFDIICPSVVCDSQTTQYSLPPEGNVRCLNNYNWSVIGGTSTIFNDNVFNVTWDNVDASGFGYVTFNPINCNLVCSEPTTIRIPVIQTIGTISGNSTMCLGSQERYILPQWPATNFIWEIEGNVNNSLGQVIETNQHNEVIITPFVTGIIKLKATYFNTLLNCGGTATFNINVTNVLQINGPDAVCQNTATVYNIPSGESTSWILKNNLGVTISTLNNSNSFTYSFVNAGTYILSVNGSIGCPSNTKNIIVVPTASTPIVVNPILVVCPNAPYTYTIAGNNTNAQYIWQVTGGSFVGSNIGNQVTIQYDNSATHQLSVFNQTVNPITCNSPTTSLTVVKQPINAQISELNSIVCANSYKDYSAVKLGILPEVIYDEGDTYTWSISNPSLGSITSGQGTKNITILWNNVLSNSDVTLTLVINKCTITSAPITKLITLRAVPTIVVTSSATSVCSGSANILNFTVAAASGFSLDPSAVTWTVNGYPNSATGLTLSNIPFYNVSGVPNNQYVTATITNPNGCNGTTTNTATCTITVNPEPTASASNVTAGGINTFCTAPQINATLRAATAAGATIQWYRKITITSAGIPVAGVTFGGVANGQINTNTYGFGFYYFIATRSGCSSTSNTIQIIQKCNDETICTISPAQTVQNNATKGCTNALPVNTGCPTCGTINLNGSVTGTPVSTKWVVNGPVNFSADNTLTASIPNPTVGVYNTFFSAIYTCTNGLLGKIQVNKNLTIAYLPDFDFKPICNNNTTFSLGVTDKTSFLSGTINRVFRYTYKLTTATTWQPLITVVNGTTLPATPLVSNLAPGNYQIKLIVTGTYLGVPQQACEKVYNLTLAGVPNTTITVGAIPCHDTAVQFNISGIPNPTDTYLWTFDNGATNTLADPKRVFTSSGPKTVTLRITNKFGCFRDLPPVNIVIPPKCFNGTVTSSPNPASVCNGNAVTLSYLPTAGECAVVNYKWMDGNVQIATTPTIQVNTEGFYWVKVSSVDNCNHETLNRITPTFKVLPTLEFPAIAAVCSNNPVTATIITNASIVSWKINNVVAPQFNNLTTITIPSGFAPGTYPIEVTVTSAGGCSKVAFQTFTVAVSPAIPTIVVTLVSCNPYQVQLTATGTSGNYNWSNGANLPTIAVNEGGPLSLTVSSGGCSVTTQVDVPRSPESLLWVFPSGCYSTCAENTGSLIGPNQPVRTWEWLLNNASIDFGANSTVTPLPLNQSGVYNLNINTGFCDLTSNDLNYTVTNCVRCLLTTQILSIVPNNDNFCSYTINLSINNSSGGALPITFTNATGDFIVSPSSFTLNAGSNMVQITVVPLSNFTGGSLNLLLTGFNVKDNTQCTLPLTITLPSCSNDGSSKMMSKKINIQGASSLLIAPNPSNSKTSINFITNLTPPTIELYSILGKKIASYTAKDTKGSWEVTTAALPSGVYIVIMKENDTVILQQKLVVE